MRSAETAVVEDEAQSPAIDWSVSIPHHPESDSGLNVIRIDVVSVFSFSFSMAYHLMASVVSPASHYDGRDLA